MIHRARRVDANQPAIVAALRKIGFSVAITSGAGDGFPDIVVGRNHRNWLIEIKDENKPPSHRVLTPEQDKFHDEWRGQVDVVKSVDEAINLVSCH